MKLVFALGNPEQRYDGTRHNVGFRVADEFVRAHGGSWKQIAKHKAHIAELRIDGIKVVVAKPTTYYNLVGESYHAIARFYDIPPGDTIIIHDDLALDYGTIRTRAGGSGGGSNGIRNLNAHDGDDTIRLRIGIRNTLLEHVDSAAFVLSRFSQHESKQLPAIIELATELIDQFIDDSLQMATYR